MVVGVQRVKHPQKLPDRLAEPPSCDASFVVLYDGWLEDLLRLHASLVAHLSTDNWELVVVDNPISDNDSDAIASLARVVHVPLAQKIGYGGGRNIGLRQSSGGVVVVVDTAVELTGDLVTPLTSLLEDEGVGIAGRWGVVTPNGFDFAESDGPDVDGVEAYLMALRRSVLPVVGTFNAKFRWYRNADLDFSFQVRAAGYRTIVDPSLPVRRHVHRVWETTPEAERDEHSRKNFWRFRDHWAERRELFVARRD